MLPALNSSMNFLFFAFDLRASHKFLMEWKMFFLFWDGPRGAGIRKPTGRDKTQSSSRTKELTSAHAWVAMGVMVAVQNGTLLRTLRAQLNRRISARRGRDYNKKPSGDFSGWIMCAPCAWLEIQLWPLRYSPNYLLLNPSCRISLTN